MKYLFDANTFIEAKNRYYTFELCPGYWEWLESFAEKNYFLSVKSVRDEIINGNDDLAEWIKDLDKKYFIEADVEIQKEFRKIVTHVNVNYTKQTEVNRFLGGADPWLIATAMSKKLIIVTHEILAPAGTKKIKIPNICKEFGIQYINTFELLRREKVVFGLR